MPQAQRVASRLPRLEGHVPAWGKQRSDPLLFFKPAHPTFQASFRQAAGSVSHSNSLIYQSAHDIVDPVVFLQRVPVHPAHYPPGLDPVDGMLHVVADL